MGPREEFLRLFSRVGAQKTGPSSRRQLERIRESLEKEHSEMVELLNSEDALSRELGKNH